jgi:hypothetical protein
MTTKRKAAVLSESTFVTGSNDSTYAEIYESLKSSTLKPASLTRAAKYYKEARASLNRDTRKKFKAQFYQYKSALDTELYNLGESDEDTSGGNLDDPLATAADTSTDKDKSSSPSSSTSSSSSSSSRFKRSANQSDSATAAWVIIAADDVTPGLASTPTLTPATWPSDFAHVPSTTSVAAPIFTSQPSTASNLLICIDPNDPIARFREPFNQALNALYPEQQSPILTDEKFARIVSALEEAAEMARQNKPMSRKGSSVYKWIKKYDLGRTTSITSLKQIKSEFVKME